MLAILHCKEQSLLGMFMLTLKLNSNKCRIDYLMVIDVYMLLVKPNLTSLQGESSTMNYNTQSYNKLDKVS